MAGPKQLTIHIKEIEDQKVIGFELKDITKDEAIVIFNRCLFRLLNGYDDYVDVKK
ncbi:hypothetical protein KY366_05770 [Candidatus Woesearchaeota archaeon]|nr:hypothetical protein [Candidatus Woesearchaeota archaeon]